MSEYDPETPFASRRASRPPRRGGRIARRLLGVGIFLAGVAAVFAVVAASLHLKLPFGINATHTSTSNTGPGGRGDQSHHAPALTVNATTVAALLQPASRVAAVPFDKGGAVYLGGYDSGGAPTDMIQTLVGASVQASGTLPGGDASAVASAIGSSVYLFGGIGSTIYQITPDATTVVGSLPTATADAAIATVHGTSYIIGGYTGTSELSTIVAFTPPGTVSVVANLPTPVRYATATALDGQVYIAGGSTGGVATATVYRFDPATKDVTTFTRLPHARDRAAAATLDGRIIVMGGLSTATGLRTRAIYAINPHGGTVHLAGLLPVALSDLTAVDARHQILVAGGIDGSDQTISSIYGITVRPH